MLSNSSFLRDFVLPIPICQPETDLGNILNVFQHLNCRLLAISLKHQNWGIINSEDLLSFLAKTWFGQKSTLVSHPRNLTYQQSIPHLSSPDFASIIKPAIVFQADSGLNKFLDYLKYESIFNEQNEYLIVDAAGELQGQIDRNKVIQFLALESNHSTKDSSQSSIFLSNLTSLLDSVALPLKIATETGQALYLNQQWQETFVDQQSSHSVDQTNTQIASWWW